MQYSVHSLQFALSRLPRYIVVGLSAALFYLIVTPKDVNIYGPLFILESFLIIICALDVIMRLKQYKKQSISLNNGEVDIKTAKKDMNFKASDVEKVHVSQNIEEKIMGLAAITFEFKSAIANRSGAGFEGLTLKEAKELKKKIETA